MTAATLDGRVFEPAPLRPSWLRPIVIAIVVALHAAALSIVYLAPPERREPPREVIVDIQPEAAPPEAPAPPAEEQKPPAQSEPPPLAEPTPSPVPPPPVAEEPPPPPLPAPVELAPPPPPPPKAVEAPPPKPSPPPRVEAAKPRPRAEPKPAPERRPHETEPRSAPAQSARGAPSSAAPSSAASAASLSAYRGEVSSIIRSRLFYPEAARARGARGMVGVAFTIGPSGAVTAFAITRSSGDRELDGAARSLIEGARFPKPPEGSARIATSFNYAPR